MEATEGTEATGGERPKTAATSRGRAPSPKSWHAVAGATLTGGEHNDLGDFEAEEEGRLRRRKGGLKEEGKGARRTGFGPAAGCRYA